MYLIPTYQQKNSVRKNHIWSYFSPKRVKKVPNDQLWSAITWVISGPISKTKYLCNQDIKIYKDLYSKYNFGLSEKNNLV